MCELPRPREMVEKAKAIAGQLIALPLNQREAELDRLENQSAVTFLMVTRQLKELSAAARTGDPNER